MRVGTLIGWVAVSGAVATLGACAVSFPDYTVGGLGSGGNLGAGGSGGGPLIVPTKADLLFVVDNSRSMADKQQVLAATVPSLLRGLTNPACVDDQGAAVSPQPAGPLDACEPGSHRAFSPILDIHLGVVSSSIGGHGADACAPNPSDPSTASNDDHGHLLDRMDPFSGATVSTYGGMGFLAWDPAHERTPPGEADIGALTQSLTDIVVGVGQVGCGYESQLESVYRFLVDPEPYDAIAVATEGPDKGQAVPSGLDAVLLQERADFLRPDSLLTVILLTDENDCSIRESGQYYLGAQLNTANGPYHLPAAREICGTDPLSACCRSCGQAVGVDENGNACPDDPKCETSAGTLDDLSDAANLRCFDQKRRFGIDFLYETDRYVQAFTTPTIPNRAGQLVPNPLYSDLDPSDAITEIRDPGLVFMAGIVGVPWQDVARDPTDAARGLMTAAELAAPDANGKSRWDYVLGDPKAFVPPADPLMVESIDPRSGTSPIVGAPLAPPGSPLDSNPVNGAERTLPGRDDLQYACIFDLPAPIPCAPGQACDCDDPQNTTGNPLCSTEDAQMQVKAKAYPGLRELAVLKGIGDQAVVGSICPAQTGSPNLSDYGYLPLVGALTSKLQQRFH